MANGFEKELYGHVAFIYGEDSAREITDRIIKHLDRFVQTHPDLKKASKNRGITEKDAILITYGDMVQKAGRPPLQTLAAFLDKHLNDVISTVHILPFFPFTSDDGFSVSDYLAVNPDLGDWDDISRLGSNFRLMFDAVINHISSQSKEFQGFLNGNPAYQDFFTVVDPNIDLSRVFRPRATPVLTPFMTPEGEKHVWTTFSTDQIDLNYRNPDVLIKVIEVLLFYVAQGAEFIRLDAVTYIWKDLDTDCANLPETHRIIQLMRTVLDRIAPDVALITETNVPHKDNIAYFGDGENEAQMVYNFALPMLVLHAFHTGDVRKLSSWAATLELPSDRATYLNYLANHDGIGVTPVKDILSGDEIDMLIQRTRKLGGNIAYKSDGDGTQTPYELNINYLDALENPDLSESDPAVSAKRFLAAQAIMLALRGVPGIYFHSMFGSRNWSEGVEKTGRYRTINREKLQHEVIEAELVDSQSLRHYVFQGYKELMELRASQKAFHPFGGQEILGIHPAVFALTRTSPDASEKVLCLQNVVDENISLAIDSTMLPFDRGESPLDLISQRGFTISDDRFHIQLEPYEILWLEKLND